MLHNTDPYGSSEAPLNMGASVNMNVPNGYNNIGKPSHDLPQNNPHYNIPNYASYGHSLMRPHSSISPFPNYQSNVFQTSFMGHTAPPMQENWQHGLLPMNLNTQSDSSNFYERKEAQHTDFRDPNVPNKSVSLNVPHVYPKPYKEPVSYPNYQNYQGPSTVRHFGENLSMDRTLRPEPKPYDLNLSSRTTIIDESRRRSLENTVKMIENILIHNPTSSDKYLQPSQLKINPTPTVQSTKDLSSNKDTSNETVLHNENKSDIPPKPIEEETQRKNDDNNVKSIYSCSTENSVESEVNSDERNNNLTVSENENNDSNNENDIVVEKVEIKIEPQSHYDSDDDIKPLIGVDVPKNPLDNDVPLEHGSVEVKIEQLSSWVDLDFANPFLKDSSGVTQVEKDGVVIESSVSVFTAEKANMNASDQTNFYECPHCSLYFTHPKRFLIHTKWHSFGLTNEKRLEKKMELLREREMKRNMKKEASQVVKTEDVKEGEVEGTFSCNVCDEVYTTKRGLKNHKLRLHKNRVRECRICHKSVTGYMAWRAHLKSHSNNSDSRFQCDECHKGFKYPHSLIKHKDTHLEKKVACEQCPKKFGSQALLNTHMKTHERQERGLIYHCSYCGKGFFESYTLQVHERTHRNERPYLCEICNTSFGTNSSLQRHLKVSHNAAKPWQCAHCHRNFMSEIIRDRHVLRHHGEQENFKFGCGQCPRRYLTQKDLNKHMQKAHPRPGRKRRGKKAAAVEESVE